MTRAALARLARYAALAVLGLAALGAHAQTPPDALVKSVTTEVMGIIAKDKDIQAGDRKKIIELVEAKVLPHFNFTSMTALAMGRNWSKAGPQQQAQLTDEFRTLLVRTYASALAAYRDQKFDFRPLRAKPTDTDVMVQVRVLQPGAQAVSIDYGMEKTAQGWKVYDVLVGGVSLVANYRTEFNNQVRDVGVDGLIKSLHSKNQALERTAAGPGKR
jgi:phospholipid transport system substrate-binding protein